MSGLTEAPVQLDIFYNTTHIEGNELLKRQRKASSQASIILSFFRANPGLLFTPPEVWDMLKLRKHPITSIRRTMTNLTKTDPPLLKMTDYMRPGLYGENNLNHCWKLA